MIINIFPDKEKVNSMMKLIEERMEFLKTLEEKNKFSTMIAENYYEIIKELGTAMLIIKGKKTIGENAHKEIIEYLLKEKEINEEEADIIQDLRIKRNKSLYEGKKIEEIYLENKKLELKQIIEKLKRIIQDRLT